MKWVIPILFNCIYSISIAAVRADNSSIVNSPLPQASQKNNFTALPLITFYNSEKGEVFNWWAEFSLKSDVAQLSDWVLRHLPLKEVPMTLSPVMTSKVHLPIAYQKTELTRLQMIELAKAFRAAYIITGDVVLSKSPLVKEATRIKVHLEILSVHNGERLQEVLRISEVPQLGLIPDLTTDIGRKHVLVDSFSVLSEGLRALQKKKSSLPIDIAVTGRMSQVQMQKLKRVLEQNVIGIKEMQVKALSPDQVVWSVEYLGAGAQALGQALSQVTPEDFYLQVAQSDAGQVLLDVKVKPH